MTSPLVLRTPYLPNHKFPISPVLGSLRRGRSKVQFVDVTAPPVRPRFPIEGDPETQGDNSCPLALQALRCPLTC